MMMNFKGKLADYVLGNLTSRNFSEIALTALNQGYDTESLWILAGMSNKDNSLDYLKYFEESLKELDITLPNKLGAAKILLGYYLSQIIASPEKAFEVMYTIDNEIYKQADWMEELRISEKKYIGEELGLEKMFTWYRELQDFEDNGMLLYYNDLPREKQREKFERHLIEEAKKLKNKIDKEISMPNNT